MRSFLLSALAILLHSGVIRADWDYDLVIENKDVAPDGFTRSSVVAGGLLRGPIITGFKGDRFRINITNNLDDPTMPMSTSIHWHGLFQQGTNWDDGASFVSQCPIIPRESFLYDFRVVDQAGTFWYHSHFSTQYCDGLRGALIVYDPQDPHQDLYDVDDESTVITLSDWYHAPSLQYAGKVPPPANTTLINSKGRYVDGPAAPLAIVNVEPNTRYRLRIISMSCDPNFTFSIDGHTLTIIEADGEYTAPYLVDSFQIFAGQRYSAILETNRPVANYWVRAQPNAGRGSQGFASGINSAILRYAGAPIEDPSTQLSPSTLPLLEYDLRPLCNESAPGAPGPDGADVSYTLSTSFDVVKHQFLINGATWTSPTVPVLLQILSGAHSAQDLLPTGSVYPLPRDKVIEIILPGSNIGGPHPFHLHGHTFAVIRSAGSSIYNYDNPVRRDVVSIGDSTDNVTIRFVTDNAGPWFLHCHIDWHLELGLAVVFAEDVEGTRETPSTEWQNLCPNYNNFMSSPAHMHDQP